MDDRKSRILAVFCGITGAAGWVLLKGQGRNQEGLLFILLGSAAAGAMLYLPVQRRKEEEEKRRRALSEEYSGMVTLLSLYMTAGLSLRSSWEKMVRDYREDRQRGAKKQQVMEEMQVTWQELRGGMYEDRAYGNFGRRCGLPEYLRLGGLLETYVRQGNRELVKMLENEAAGSLVQALQEVKKRGEQTQTKLLLPIMLLFALTLALVVIPAMMSMQAAW
ncbi:MAG: hypothetical protein II882_09520 [Lachnospiraceae bacterium]|nr:hypothetical protein [Lachnospiraceae bacterium]